MTEAELDRGDAAALIRQQPARIAIAAAFIPDHRIIGRGIAAMYITPQHGARAVIFTHQRIAIIQKPRQPITAVHLIQPAQRIITQARRLRTRCRNKPVTGRTS